MSLTSEIADKESPVARFFAEHFSTFDAFWGAWKAEVSPLSTLRPAGQVAWGTIGTALDYRLRYCFDITPWNAFVAAIGAAHLSGEREVVLKDGSIGILSDFDPRVGPSPIQKRWGTLIAEFVVKLEGTVETVRPIGRRLNADDETEFCRYCYALSLFEEFYRVGPLIRSPLLDERLSTVDDLLALPSSVAIEDLRQLVEKFHDSCGDLLARPAILNPIFAGSRNIGGADADLIVDGCLIDIKATVNPLKLREAKWWTYQIIGYALLDYDDQYAIKSVGIYLARQGLLLRWNLDTLLPMLAGASVPTLTDLRRSFRAAVDESFQRHLLDRKPNSVDRRGIS